MLYQIILIVDGFEIFICECLPWHVGICLPFVKNVNNMHEQREIFEINKSQFGFAADSLTHDSCDHETFKGYAGEGFRYLIVIKSLTHEHSATASASAKDCNIKVSESYAFAFKCASLKLHEGVGFSHCLRECASL